MKLNPIAANVNEVEIGEITVLFSYKTPVAVQFSDGSIRKTAKPWSVTTSRHINKWLRGFGLEPGDCPVIPQSKLDSLIA